MENKMFDWDAANFFRKLTAHNKFAIANGFTFCRVSGLQGFEDALQNMQNSTAFVAVSNVSNGYTDIRNSPRTRRVKTVFLAMRHPLDDAEKRQSALDKLNELFRQFMSVLMLEKTALEQNLLFIDDRIKFNEIDSFFFSGCACAYFQIAVDTFTDLRLDDNEWQK